MRRRRLAGRELCEQGLELDAGGAQDGVGAAVVHVKPLAEHHRTARVDDPGRHALVLVPRIGREQRVRQPADDPARVVQVEQHRAELVATGIAPVHRVIDQQPPGAGADRWRTGAAHQRVPRVLAPGARVVAGHAVAVGELEARLGVEADAGRDAVKQRVAARDPLRKHDPVLVGLVRRGDQHRCSPVPAPRGEVGGADRGDRHARRAVPVEPGVGHVDRVLDQGQPRILAAAVARSGAPDAGAGGGGRGQRRRRQAVVDVGRRVAALVDGDAVAAGGVAEDRAAVAADGAVDEVDAPVQADRAGVEHGHRLPVVGRARREDRIGGGAPEDCGRRGRPRLRVRQRHFEAQHAAALAPADDEPAGLQGEPSGPHPCVRPRQPDGVPPQQPTRPIVRGERQVDAARLAQVDGAVEARCGAQLRDRASRGSDQRVHGGRVLRSRDPADVRRARSSW